MRREPGDLRRAPDQRQHAAAGRGHPPGLAQRGDRVRGVLEGVEAGDRVERGVGERQRLQLALDDVGAGDATAHEGQEPGRGVEPGHLGAAVGGQPQREPRAAADIEEARAGGDAERVEGGRVGRCMWCSWSSAQSAARSLHSGPC